MKIHHMGSSFLDDHSLSSSMSRKAHEHEHSVIKYARDRKPLITPCIKSGGSKKGDEGQQYLLIPNKDHVSVLSMSHGQTVCKLVPYSNKEKVGESIKGNRSILTTAIMKYDKSDIDASIDDSVEFSLIAGFSDGTLQEWSLSSIPLNRSKNKTISPKRNFRLPSNYRRASITHVTSPVGGDCSILYALVKVKKVIEFVQINIPKMSEEDDDEVNFVSLDNVSLLTTIRKKYSVLESEKTDENVAEENTENVDLALRKLPFSLTSVCCERKGVKVTHVVIAHERGISIYCENNTSIQNIPQKGRFVSYFQEKIKGSICAVALAPNGEDVALGCVDGKIDILVSVLSQSTSYVEDLSPTKIHPKASLIRRTIHWHSLPVKTLCYLGLPGSRAAPNLLSGGEEAVVVTWNIERGLNRPANTMARISKGCITHIVTNPYPISSSAGSTDMDIIVRCMDNTLQLIHGNNHAIRWKIQGLATTNNECVGIAAEPGPLPPPMLQIDPKTRSVLMTRLSGAPGFIHWYDVASNQVVGELEVAPYNRISRKEAHHNAYPRPTVTNFVFSASGNDLITVDTMLTENTSLGKSCEVDSFVKEGTDLSQKMSLVTNIKFWSLSREVVKNKTGERHAKGMPFELISAMPNPHGYINGEIDALAISHLGSRACSLSVQEGAFHIWGKGKTINTDKNSLSPLLPSWKRLCKITIPSGYSSAPKHETGQDKNSTVAFSDDGSVLAIAFGRHITLWDHSNATLLKSFCTHESLCNIQFVRSPLDMILAVGKSSVSMLPPFCGGYLGTDSWSYKLSQNSTKRGQKIELGLVTPLASRKELAVAMKQTQEKGKKLMISTKVVIVDMVSGKAKERDDGTLCNWEVEGSVLCLCDISHIQENWASEEAVLLVLTDGNDIFILDADNDNGSTVQKRPEQDYLAIMENNKSSALSSTDAPTLDMDRKRKSEEDAHRVGVSSTELKNVDAVGKGSLVFDSIESASLSTSQLPALSGNFTRSFISRNFKKFKYDD